MASVKEQVPDSLATVLQEIASLDRNERIELLLEYADRFREVPPEIARRPFPEEHRVQHCESKAYVWVNPTSGQRLKLHFAVENPQGVSARALAVILDETLSGRTAEEIARVPTDIVFDIFGKEVTMGKGEGLTGIVSMVTSYARRHLARSAVDKEMGEGS